MIEVIQLYIMSEGIATSSPTTVVLNATATPWLMTYIWAEASTATRCPTATPVASSPTWTTLPQNSCPGLWSWPQAPR